MNNYRVRQNANEERYAQRIVASNGCYKRVEKVDVGMGKYAIINMDTGNKLSNVSKRYTLVKNEEVFQPFVNRFGVQNVSRFIEYGRGKFAHMRINTGREFNFGTEEKPDIIKEQIIVENSYNKTRSFRFMFGAFRLVCTNGLYSGNCSMKYKKIHVGEIPVQEIINNVINNYEKNSFELWKSFKEIPLTLEAELKMLETFEAFEIKEENKHSWDLNSQIRRRAIRLVTAEASVDNQRNGWGLFNQINRAIEYEVSGRSAVSKRMLGNRKAEEFLTAQLNLN